MSEQTSQQDQAQPEVSPPSQKAEPQQERGGEGQPSPGLRNSKGWDGKLRVEKTAVLANPEVLSDPEASDDSNVIPGEQLPADEDLLDSDDEDAEELSCTNSRVASIPALRLERFKRCARLCLRKNLITDIEGLEPLAGTLRELDLYDNLISHINGHGLAPLTGLEQLDLSFNKIRHIRNLGHLVNLTDLFLIANRISVIENLENLTKLRMLELGSNRIREIRGLDTLTALESLWLAKNKITSLRGLKKLPNLRLLSIQSNRITDLSPLADVPSLEELYVGQNMLEGAEVLEGLSSNVRIKVLDITGNRITSLKGLSALSNLEELWASSNLLSDFAEIERELGGAKNLNTVYFEGNPLQLRAPALYRNKVKLALPQVQQIDATYVRVS